MGKRGRVCVREGLDCRYSVSVVENGRGGVREGWNYMHSVSVFM